MIVCAVIELKKVWMIKTICQIPDEEEEFHGSGFMPTMRV